LFEPMFAWRALINFPEHVEALARPGVAARMSV
jgi:hypothetical protein